MIERLALRLLLALALLSGSTFAATFYVRVDGGVPPACDGTTNSAAPAAHCAWSSPMLALPPAAYGQTAVPRIAGGDTLQVADGSYMIGFGAPGTSVCNQGAAYACTMAPIPSGPDAAHPTRILGNLAQPVELWGTERVYSIINLTRSNNVEVAGFELTDHSACIHHHCGGASNPNGCAGGPAQIDACNDTVPPYGPWADNGIIAADSANVSLHDLVIHGLANEGVRGGRLTDWTVQRVKIIGNGFAGWDGDISNGAGGDTSNHGTLRFENLEVAWNGCTERYPALDIYGCWGQDQGGYGDGFGTGHTSGHWIVENSHFHHNVSDGLDLLYGDSTATVEVRRSQFDANAGNQLKVRAGTAMVEDNLIDGNCAQAWSTWPPNNYGGSYVPADFRGTYNMDLAANCRSSGDAIAFSYLPGSQFVLRNNTIAGMSSCLQVNSQTGNGGGSAGATEYVANNVFDGNTNQNWQMFATGGGRQSVCGQYDYLTAPAVTFDHNIFWGVKDGQCPAGSTCSDPKLANPSPTALDPMLLAGSPALGAGDPAQCPLGQPCNIGVLTGASPPPPPPVRTVTITQGAFAHTFDAAKPIVISQDKTIGPTSRAHWTIRQGPVVVQYPNASTLTETVSP